MRKLYVSKYLGTWSVRYLKNGQHPAWPLHSFSIKTHGLISYPDLLFATEEEAVDYAKTIAENINFHYEQDYTEIITPNKTINYSERKSVDLAHIDYKPPSTEINQFGRINRSK
jgi:hypothetical protein